MKLTINEEHVDDIKISRKGALFMGAYVVLAAIAFLTGNWLLGLLGLMFAWDSFRDDVKNQVISYLSLENASLKAFKARDIQIPGAQYFE